MSVDEDENEDEREMNVFRRKKFQGTKAILAT
jgi:hypothetical protein